MPITDGIADLKISCTSQTMIDTNHLLIFILTQHRITLLSLILQNFHVHHAMQSFLFAYGSSGS